MSPSDLPDDISVGDFFAFRRVRICSTQSTVVHEHLQSAQRQIRANQGPELQKLIEGRKAKDAAVKPSHLQYVPTLKSLIAKAEVILQKKQAKARDAELSARLGAEASSEEEVEVVEQAGGRLEVGSHAVALAKAGNKRKKGQPSAAAALDRGGAKREASPANSRGRLSKASRTSAVNEPADLDAEMQAVALRLGTTPSCLVALTVQRGWSDSSIGNQIWSVTRCGKCCLPSPFDHLMFNRACKSREGREEWLSEGEDGSDGSREKPASFLSQFLSLQFVAWLKLRRTRWSKLPSFSVRASRGQT